VALASASPPATHRPSLRPTTASPTEVPTPAVGQRSEGEACGLQCGQCALPADGSQDCAPGYTCVNGLTGCSRRYSGVCVNACTQWGRDAAACAAVGPQCVFFTHPSAAAQCRGDGGCRLDSTRFIYNEAEACELHFRCQTSCDNSGGCVWSGLTCRSQYALAPAGLAAEATPNCWQRCAWKTGAVNPAEPCAVQDFTVAPTSVLPVTRAPTGGTVVTDASDSPTLNPGDTASPTWYDPATEGFCRTFNTLISCEANAGVCSWAGSRTLPQCAGNGACHVVDFCSFTCKTHCDRFARRCKWVDGFGCTHLGVPPSSLF
jgi:hypothetical protein